MQDYWASFYLNLQSLQMFLSECCRSYQVAGGLVPMCHVCAWEGKDNERSLRIFRSKLWMRTRGQNAGQRQSSENLPWWISLQWREVKFSLTPVFQCNVRILTVGQGQVTSELRIMLVKNTAFWGLTQNLGISGNGTGQFQHSRKFLSMLEFEIYSPGDFLYKVRDRVAGGTLKFSF